MSKIVYTGTLKDYITGGDCYAGNECRIKSYDDDFLEAQVCDKKDGKWFGCGDDIETSHAIFIQAFAEALLK